MSADETAELEVEETEPAGEPGQMNERTAKAVLLVIMLGAVWGIVAAFPWVAYVIVGVLGTLGWQKAHGWIGRRAAAKDGEEGPEDVEVDVVAALQYLGRGGRNVLLTELRDELGVADTKTVRGLLGEARVDVRPGVRTLAGNGPGVHWDDIAALSPVGDDSHGDRCSCRSEANANANNGEQEEPGEGLRVETIGQAGAVIRDPADDHRYHRVQ